MNKQRNEHHWISLVSVNNRNWNKKLIRVIRIGKKFLENIIFQVNWIIFCLCITSQMFFVPSSSTSTLFSDAMLLSYILSHFCVSTEQNVCPAFCEAVEMEYFDMFFTSQTQVRFRWAPSVITFILVNFVITVKR